VGNSSPVFFRVLVVGAVAGGGIWTSTNWLKVRQVDRSDAIGAGGKGKYEEHWPAILLGVNGV
jgi:hypothetical protein